MRFDLRRASCLAAALLLAQFAGLAPLHGDEPADASEVKLSYRRQIKPILQAHCQGCHQPAKPGGEYVMTAFDQLLKGGESESAAIVPGNPDESYLMDQIVPVDGEASMPKDKPPLSDAEIDLIRRWIQQGAENDDVSASVEYNADNPPVYSRAPVITSMDFSPDGKWLAIAGFHEVRLLNAETGELAARLIGMSSRIETVKFSPDGARLVATGGNPARMGEVQIWDVASRKLLLSVSKTFNTIYGGSWSPDGKLIAFGCADNTVRAIDAETGEEVLFQGAHNDWIRDTVFSKDGSHLISAGRDMTCKLTEVATQRFVDNITSITPKALKGGVSAVARHPERDEIVIGGADGVTKVYRIFRITARRIGDDANLIREMPPLPGRIFDVDVSRDGKRIASVSSLDGIGHVAGYTYEFDTALPDAIKKINSKTVSQRSQAEKDQLKAYHRKDVKQLFAIDIPDASTYAVKIHPDGKRVAVGSSDGVIRMLDLETGKELRRIEAVAGLDRDSAQLADIPDYIQDVSPLLSRLGCNQGTCHGSAKGKAGFKLSLRGYDPIFDVRALTDDLKARRVNLASPENSLMLLKPLGEVPHEGGQLFSSDDPYYHVLRKWIAGGAKLDLSSARVVAIEVLPLNPVVENEGERVAMTVVATYSDGSTRDVTTEAFLSSGNTEVATVDASGAMTAVRRGEAAVLARYEGAYAATTLTVMGNRDGFAWQPPETWGRIDELVAEKWQRMKIRPSGLCTDAEFIRRVTLDLTGLPPTAEQVKEFLADDRPTREKRAAKVDELIGTDAFVDYWTNKWADLLQVNRKFLGTEGAAGFRRWIREQVDNNTPYDEFARMILEAEGSNKDNPAASYYKVLRTPEDTMENTTHLFLAVRFNCNKCHDHPFERWTQDQYYQTAAFFSQVALKADPQSGKRRIGGTAVEGAKPLYEIVYDNEKGEVTHERTGVVAPPEFPFECSFEAEEEANRRQRLSAWITSPDNPYFAKSYVNRLWGYMLGTGIIEPIDDIRAGNPPTNPQLLEHLTEEFVASDFDVRKMIRDICNSRTYQLSVETNQWNADDQLNYSHAQARRLPAEVLYDAIHFVTGSQLNIPGVPPGTRAAALPDSGIKLPDNFLNNLGRPARESACECERTSGLQLGPIMALVSGPTVGNAIGDRNNALAKLVNEIKDDRQLVDEVLLRILNRPATEQEFAAFQELSASIEADHKQLEATLAKREQWWKEEKPKRLEQQAKDIAAAKQELAEYEAKIAPQIAEKEKARAEAIAAAKKELESYEKQAAARLDDFAKKHPMKAEWHLLTPKSLSATGKVSLQRQADRSILASGDDKTAVYTMTAETALQDIQGLRLEAMADPSLGGGGPGLPENGNFVVTELEVFAAPADQPDKFVKVELANAKADFSQDSFGPDQTIDGKATDQRGWAVHPAGGVDHWATYELKQPLENAEGVILKFVVHQKHQAENHLLGRFRFSVTATPKGWGLSLPESLAALFSVPQGDRTESQTTQLTKYTTAVDPGLKERRQHLAEAQKPVPADPGVAQRKASLARISQPIKDDATLISLRKNIETSKGQVSNQRLTAVQDLAWALINSPAFLFNH